MTQRPPRIAVLLATYNGEKYVGEQLESLWAQTTQDFVVLARDDGSSDGTTRILAQAARDRPDRLRVLEGGGSRLGPMNSFGWLLRQCDADYIAFCDQDDFWEADKLERFQRAIADQEAVAGVQCPVLCCSDVAVADVQLRVTSPSYYERHRIHPSADGMPMARLIFRNFVIGASSMINRALREAAEPLPEAAIMHDWWLALVAQSIGRVVVIPGPSMRYRQHGANAVGSRKRRLPSSVAQLKADWNWSCTSVARCVRQAEALYERHGSAMSTEDQRLLRRFQTFRSRGPFGRLRIVVQSRAFKPTVPLNTLHLLACATAKI